ncbi:von Willebrand factor A domain-containing protein 3A [Sinocyclocheilus grahami]|uniref:von Willebrand factor A domain-containing protein 3A n=1 Tax=Sinocyclocheilus grahami TaxID=75366 RepID=UPI0007ACFF8F|nr:PREDICTED: von Willebrand factor A domain-containing protein 3A-like [Sinocyclocheilus grahami]
MEQKTGPGKWLENSPCESGFVSDQSSMEIPPVFRENKRMDHTEAYESSEHWLESSGLESCGLSLSHLLSLCTTAPVSERGDGVSKQMHISSESLADFEEQLYIAVEMYHDQIKWLSQGNRKVFGVVNGSRVGVLVDTSDLTCSTERLADLQRELLALIDEQLRFKKQLHLLSYGSEVSSLWDKPLDTCPLRLRECCAWVMQLRAGGGCGLLQALQRALTRSELDTLLIILGSRPDQTVDVICDFLTQNRMPCVHAVAYSCSSPAAIETVKQMAEVSGGRYHLFSAALGVVDSSTDVDLLWAEIKAARNVLTQIQNMRQGRLGDTAVTVDSEISTGLDSLTLSDFSPVSSALSAPLCIQTTGPVPTTSSEWLKTHGLKAQKLDLYQLLARNAYSPQEMFVPVLGKTVSSTVHERVMVRFEWHDGTVKNLHVGLPSLQKYQKRLMGAVHLFERRVQWLNRTGSQQIWGTVCEQRVQVLLDTSGMNAHYQLHIQHAIRILLQEQLANKHSFNVIVFGSDVKSWQEKMVPSTHENLQAVWLWIQAVECVGGRNTLAALRCALEEETQEESSLTQGVYLLTTGMPDQHMVSVTAYVSERCSATNLNLHVCLFTGEEDTARCPLPRYATRTETARALSGLAHAGNGRFLWMTDTGIVESDDISALIGEMETAVNYFQKCLNNSWEPEEKFETPARYDQLLMFRKVHPGVIFKKYPKSKSVRKSIATVKLPKHEDICSTKQTGCSFADAMTDLCVCVRFNMLAFSEEVRMWQPALVQSTEELCVEAVQWLNQLSTHGASSTLQALQTGCGFADAVGLYLITDGRCDSSHSRILTEIETLRQEKDFTVHTIAVNCHDSEFLKSLAHKTGGRFHQAPENTDRALIRKLLSDPCSVDPVLPKCEGDDLRKLSEEIEKLRLFQKQAKAFRETSLESRNQTGT